MDTLILFESLANIAHPKEISELIDSLSLELKAAFLKNDSQLLRKIISGKTDFPDSRTVAQD